MEKSYKKLSINTSVDDKVVYCGFEENNVPPIAVPCTIKDIRAEIVADVLCEDGYMYVGVPLEDLLLIERKQNQIEVDYQKLSKVDLNEH